MVKLALLDLQDFAHRRRATGPAVRLGVTVMLFGEVGQSCWQTPQPVQPSSITRTATPSSCSAISPTGQWSTQIVQASTPVSVTRRHVSACQPAVPMSMSLNGVGCSAPVGQLAMQSRPSQSTQGGSVNIDERHPAAADAGRVDLYAIRRTDPNARAATTAGGLEIAARAARPAAEARRRASPGRLAERWRHRQTRRFRFQFSRERRGPYFPQPARRRANLSAE